MVKTLLNKDGEPWCPTCGTVFAENGTTVVRAGARPHGTACPHVALDLHGNIRTQAYVNEEPAAEEVA